ncbi:MAG: ATP-binding protein [bacterium]
MGVPLPGNERGDFAAWAQSIEEHSPIWNEAEDMARIGAWALDVRTGATSWTRGVYEIYGVQVGDVTEKETALSYYEAEDQTRLREAIRNAIEKQLPYDMTCRLRRNDGVVRTVRTTGKPILEGDSVVRLTGVIQDITEQHRVEEQLRESEHNFREIVDSVDAVFWVRSSDLSRLLYVSDSYETKYRNSVQAAYENSFSFLDNVHPDDKPLVAAADKEYWRTNLMDIEYRVWKRDGSIAWVNARSYPIRDSAGAIVRHVGIAIDITRRKKYEQLLERQDALQRLVTSISTSFVRSPVGSVDAEIDQAIKSLAQHFNVDRGYVFQRAEEASTFRNTHEWCSTGTSSHKHRLQNLALAPGSWLHRTLFTRDYVLVPRIEDLPESASTERQEFATEGIRTLLGIPMHGDNEFIGFIGFDSVHDHRTWELWEIELLRVAANAIAAAIQRAEHERTALDAREKAERAAKAKSDFLARMSHELRTPLNAVIGFSDLLSTTALSEHQREYNSNVIVSAKALRGLIDDILDFSNIDSGHLKVEPTAVQIRNLLRETLTPFELQTVNRGVSVEYTIDPAMPVRVVVDPLRLRQVVSNLLGNAVKFTQRGFIRLKAGVEPQNDILLIRVEDSGVGIDASKLDMVFESFAQADESTTRAYGGSGLGLAIARRLAERMGGSLRATSVPGAGSVFSLAVPLILPETNVPAEMHNNNTKPRASTDTYMTDISFSVLIAEDNALNAILARELIKTVAPNATVHTVRDGRSAVNFCLEDTPDIILMDIQMPELDGHEATRAIRSSGLARQPYIIALTAGASSEDEELSHMAGMDAHLSKPIMRESLYTALMNAVEFTSPSTGETNMTVEAIARTLQDRGHGEDTIAEVLDLLRERIPELRASIAEGLSTGDATTLAREGHSAKGILRTLMLDELGESAHELEQAAKSGTRDAMEGAATKLLTQLEQLQQDL